METLTESDIDLELLFMEEHEDVILCESQSEGICLERPPHPAHWWAFSPCGTVIAVCNRRKEAMHGVGSWRCTPTPSSPNGHREYYNEVIWVPIVR